MAKVIALSRYCPARPSHTCHDGRSCRPRTVMRGHISHASPAHCWSPSQAPPPRTPFDQSATTLRPPSPSSHRPCRNGSLPRLFSPTLVGETSQHSPGSFVRPGGHRQAHVRHHQPSSHIGLHLVLETPHRPCVPPSPATTLPPQPNSLHAARPGGASLHVLSLRSQPDVPDVPDECSVTLHIPAPSATFQPPTRAAAPSPRMERRLPHPAAHPTGLLQTPTGDPDHRYTQQKDPRKLARYNGQ